MWPAIVLDESLVAESMGLNKHAGDKSVLVQFFGTHDFARYYDYGNHLYIDIFNELCLILWVSSSCLI